MGVKSTFLRAVTRITGKVITAPLDAVEQALGFAAATAITAVFKPLQYKLNRKFSYELLAISELQVLLNRGDITEAQFNDELADMGYNEQRRQRLKTLAGQIPSVSDFIRMSVREVFTPATAELYGQYEDYPSDLDKFAKMAGLDVKYAKYYWAAHWELPSYTQGIDMYHRGIIDFNGLKTLLKSLDVMPYWRERLIKLAETPYTRVDVRRMYQAGVLDADEVARAYMDLGYSEDKAKKMTQFVISGVKGKDKSLTKAELIQAYEEGLTSKEELYKTLGTIGYSDDEIELMLSLSDMKKARKYTTQYINALKGEYLNARIDEGKARIELNKLGLKADALDEILSSWKLEVQPNITIPTKAELLKWYTAKLIDKKTVKEMLRQHGYADRWIDLYLYEPPETGGGK